MSNAIAQALNIEPDPIQINPPKKSKAPETTQELHDEAYESIKGIADVGEMAMFELAQIAAQSESPRAYEVLAKLMGEIVSANEKLVELKSKKLELEEKENGRGAPSTVHNNLIVASTSEVLKQLRGANATESE